VFDHTFIGYVTCHVTVGDVMKFLPADLAIHLEVIILPVDIIAVRDHLIDLHVCWVFFK
jgi:hypothetical protein